MKVLTAAEMQHIDKLTTEKYGVPSLALMENAGRAVVRFLAERFQPLASQQIAILCGRGNNGGDGFVVARLFQEQGIKPRVVLFANPRNLRGDAAKNFERLEQISPSEIVEGIEAWQRVKKSIADTTLIIDALFGTGLSKPLEGFFAEIVRDVNSAFPGARVVSIDLPSGVSADSGELIGESIRANATLTFTAPKLAHVFPPACERAGEWAVEQIGTPAEALENDPDLKLNLTTPADVEWIAQPRKADANKGHFGHVLIFAGSVGKTGAAAMAAKAALRAGAGLVTVATAKSALPIVSSLGMEFMTAPLPESEEGTVSIRGLDFARLDNLVEGKSVLALGPGLGTIPETVEFIRAVVDRYDLPLVLDADGLNAFAGCMKTFRSSHRAKAPAVLTPHPGEMARLTGKTIKEIQADRVSAARDFAARHNVTLVLKGFRTIIASPDGQAWINPTGNPGMATGGTGDVLTGLLAGLWAQFRERPAEKVAAAAVYLHGLAGDHAAREFGEAPMIAGDLLNAIPSAFRTFARELRPGRMA